MNVRKAVTIELLRPLRLRIAGSEVSAGPPRQQVVLAYLALHAGTVVHRDELIDAVWGQAAPSSVVGNLHTYVSALRRVLRRDDQDDERILPASGSGYLLDIDDNQLDLRQFEHGLAMAAERQRAGSFAEARQLWGDALRRWVGTPFAGMDAPFVEAERARLATLRSAAIADLAEASWRYGGESDILAALTTLRQALDEYPLHERLTELRIEILNVRGRRADALAQFEHTRRLLADELGIEPGDRLRSAHRRTLAGVPNLAVAKPWPLRNATGSTRLPARPALFAGRETELAELGDRLAELPASPLVVCAIDGPPGIGKTALAVEFAHQVRERFPDGCHYVDLRGLHGTDPPLTAAEASRVLIESVGGVAAVPGSQDDRLGTYRRLMADKRALLILDDADDICRLRPLLVAGAGTMVVVTSRRRLGGLVARDGAVRMSLDVLPPGEAADVLTGSLGRSRESLGGAEVDELVRLCGGLPLALSFAAGQLGALPHPDAAQLRDWLQDRRTRLSRLRPVSGSGRSWTVEEVFSWSFSNLDSDSVEVFGRLGGQEGDSATAAAVAVAGDWPIERARRALDELAMAGLLDWAPRDTYHITPLLHLYAAYRS
ncbi:BTAD domain-containing putative transcriptional regulator [Amycolatopsis sp. BJA-103]|uniref:AfsR/SARP family transcriptional regulator n=1 Tax=Amycolatopsis sp. BJA-103 TaxID=1911175 RepID=UPI000C7827FB|nr:BTAD domain-containing putative transcriptional regulator [Amycolatopsis sp. BJA-103]